MRRALAGLLRALALAVCDDGHTRSAVTYLDTEGRRASLGYAVRGRSRRYKWTVTTWHKTHARGWATSFDEAERLAGETADKIRKAWGE